MPTIEVSLNLYLLTSWALLLHQINSTRHLGDFTGTYYVPPYFPENGPYFLSALKKSKVCQFRHGGLTMSESWITIGVYVVLFVVDSIARVYIEDVQHL